MKSAGDSTNDLTIPAPLQAEIRAMAAEAHRPADEIVREALEGYLLEMHERLRVVPDARTRAEAAARMRQRRSECPLPEGMTIEDVIAWGRAPRDRASA